MEAVLDGEIEAIAVRLDQAQLFCDSALEEAIDLQSLTPEQRLGLAHLVAETFFGVCLAREVETAALLRHAVFKRTGVPGSRGKAYSLHVVLGSYPPEAYRVLVYEMRLSEALLYLAKAAVFEVERQIEQKRTAGGT